MRAGPVLGESWAVPVPPALAAALCLGLATPALAGPAYDASGIAAPCLAASPDVEGFRAAFEMAGWAEAQGAGRTRALRALGEVQSMVQMLPRLDTPEDYRHFIEKAHQRAEMGDDWLLVMVHEGLSAGLTFYEASAGDSLVNCYMTGTDLPAVAEAMAQPKARQPDHARPLHGSFGGFSENPDLPGYRALHYDWIVIAPPFTPEPPLLGAQSIIVSYSFDAAAPPEPPVTQPNPRNSRNVRKHP
ncbi:hypothetical protein [Frigidibacter sp. ROC022]|uniref:hypothetical protein n=1 Tax=Frigidibacter sp. ROC022 TaxID=2971796 RepID=UPI00215A394C|nr:hypothetical protein [Frigidibacter sp. ROC022]MCR8724062.1 hypothetical protein [Frigidibacter sp. ROC022]